ncbi:hypothetical protein ABIE21_000449 [Conyzicola nivalis]|uniref:DUF222 domain-containing protein n=1 Tax=Conyzicola nivalis TaxID=1477021 RepID=A0ABV2QIT9_9MICO
MTITDIADDTGPGPAPVLQDDPTFEPPPDDLAPGSFSAPSSFASSSFGAPLFEPPPEWESMPDPRTLSPHVQRQMLLGRFLDDAEVADRQLAVSAARRAVGIEELRRISVMVAAEEEADDLSRPPELRANVGQEAGWSIRNRAAVELATEVAAAFTLSKNAARHLIQESRTLVTDLPATLEALHTGTVRYEHARLIASTAWSLPEQSRGAFEQEVLPWAKTLIYSAFRRKVLQARERLHTESMEERHERAAAFRSVTLEPGEDGIGFLTIRDSTEVVAAIYNRVTAIALPTFQGDPRTLAQRRADVATAILLEGDLCAVTDDALPSGDGAAGSGRRLGHGITAQVHIEIPVLTLLGQDTAPATLDGSIPIDPATARRLVADAPGFYRLLTDPITGTVIAFDDRYRYLPKSLRRAVELVDGTCTAPWCDATAGESHGHHPGQWADTRDTSLANSALLCESDHRTVHNTRWTMVKLPDGDKMWVSPCGRIRKVAPHRRLSPAFVEALADQKPDTEKPETTTDDSWNTPDDPDQEMPF